MSSLCCWANPKRSECLWNCWCLFQWGDCKVDWTSDSIASWNNSTATSWWICVENNKTTYNVLYFFFHFGVFYWNLRQEIHKGNVKAVSYAWIYSWPLFHVSNKYQYEKIFVIAIYCKHFTHPAKHQRSLTKETLQLERTTWTLHWYRHGDRKGEVSQEWIFLLASYDNTMHSQTFFAN